MDGGNLECNKLTNPTTQTEGDEAAEEPSDMSEPGPNTEPITSDDIPAGNYVGKIEFTDDWLIEAQSITSEVIITIAEDGKVTGSFSGQIVNRPYSYENCSIQWESMLLGEFSGRLTEPTGLIQSSETMDFDPNKNAGCSDTFETASGSFNRGVEIKISGNKLTGITNPRPDIPSEMFILTFNATKQ